MKMIKLELRKAFTGKRFYLVICIGQFLSISSIVTVYRLWLSQKEYIKYWESRFPVRQTYTLYNVWILNEQLSIGRTLFFFWLPFLAAFPFAASYYQEEKKRQLCLVLVRTGRAEYFRAKYLSVFISGFVVIAGTLITNLAISAALFPWEKPLPFYPYFCILENDFGASLFYTHPFLYAMIYIVIAGIFGGLLAGFVFISTMYIKNQFISFGIILLIYVGAETVKNMLYVGNLNAIEISVYGFLRASGYERNGWVMLCEGIIFLIIQLLLVEKQGKSYEIY